MKSKFLKMAIVGLILTVSGLANAGLIEADFLATNDGFYDTETGLYWVDLNKYTQGNISHMRTQIDAFGATMATTAQITQLFANVDDVATFFSFAGAIDQSPYLWGFYDDGNPTGPGGQAFIVNDGRKYIVPNRSSYQGGHEWLSAWAVYDVPEPSTLAIFALGMIGLASRRFKKQS